MKQHSQHQYSKMVSGFRRSLSFPSPRSPRHHKGSPEKSHHHLRSTSLPCRFHPFVSHLEDDIRSLRSWQSQPPPDPTASPAWIADGLARLDHLHASLHDLLNLSQSQDQLRRRAAAGWADRLLDDSLRLADAHGTFRSSVIALRQHHSATQAAIRRSDEARLASCVRSQRRAEKELARLASAVRDVARPPPALACEDAAEAELAGIMWEVTAVTASASAAVFSGVAAVSSATLAPASRWSRFRMVGPLLGRTYVKGNEEGEMRRRSALQRLEVLEESMGALEEKSERVFRRLVNTRVSLLNILTPSF